MFELVDSASKYKKNIVYCPSVAVILQFPT